MSPLYDEIAEEKMPNFGTAIYVANLRKNSVV